MAPVVDLWHNKDRTRSELYSKGRRWQVIYIDPEGKRKRPMFTTKEEAEAALVDNVVAVNTGTYVSKVQKELTFSDLWPRFEKIKSNKSKKT